ncbi:MAG: hypothetical protein QM770_01890 [Tepidisphaeraceae bacterium]
MHHESHRRRQARANATRKGRFTTGVSLEPEVVAYLDDLAGRMRLTRSYVLNTIVYEYARLMERRDLRPLSGVPGAIRL